MHHRFASKYNFFVDMDESLCDRLLGRMSREIQRQSHSYIEVERVHSAMESSKLAPAKEWKIENVMITVGDQEIPMDLRSVRNNILYVDLLTLLLEGGYALAGCFAPTGQTDS